MCHRTSSLCVVFAATLLATSATFSPAHGWRGDGRAAGIVRAVDGHPLQGARVTLRWSEDPAAGPAEVLTNANGRWALPGLAPGLWKITVEADQHIAAHGQVVVPESGRMRSVEIRLRSLDEVSPTFTEGNPFTIVEAPPARPLLPAEPHRSGRYRTTFQGRGPLSGLGIFAERSGVKRAEIEEHDADPREIVLAEESFEVYVPDGYGPATPHGLLVWISPGPFGGSERADVQAVFDEMRVIFVGANDSGNQRPRWDRYALALDAAFHMQRLYDIDPRRVYVAGYSGGGRVASSLAMLYPEMFQGALAFFGCNFYRRTPVPDRPGAYWPAAFKKPRRDSLKQIKRERRFVLLTGERDFNRQQSRAIYEAMLEEGFRHVTYLEIPGADHYHGIDPVHLAIALHTLDRE